MSTSSSFPATAAVISKKEQKPRDKTDDLPFPMVYFSFIALFVAFKFDMLKATMPTFDDYSYPDHPSHIPELRTAILPLFSFFIICPILYIWRTFVKTRYLAPTAKNWAGLHPGTPKYDKFLEQAWLALHYSVATTLGYLVLRNEPWWPPVISESAQIAISAPQEERLRDQVDKPGLFILYSLQLGFYSLELITLLTTKNRRSDAMVYFFHHIFTLFLLAGSWVSYNHRVGSLVLFLHDAGDIFLPIGKCYSYAEEHLRNVSTPEQFERHKNTGMFFFVLFVIAFAIPRLFFFGGLIYQGYEKYHWYICCGVNLKTGYCGRCGFNRLWSIELLTTLGLLYPMHVYWFYLIVKMAIRLLLQPNNYEDVRSDED